MKKSYLIATFLIFDIFITGCAGIGADNEPPKVNTELTYKDMLGTYIFKPDTTQAKKLGVIAGDTIILKITDDSLKRIFNIPKSVAATVFAGKYYINKMILVYNKEANKSYNGTWTFFYSKDNVPGRNMNSNLISFYQKITNNYDFNFDVERDDQGVLHLAAFIPDAKYEFIKLIDFKKIK